MRVLEDPVAAVPVLPPEETPTEEASAPSNLVPFPAPPNGDDFRTSSEVPELSVHYNGQGWFNRLKKGKKP